jgi:hypothetical protein
MNKNSRSQNPKAAGYANEILFSLNVSFAIASVVELEAHRVVAPFFWLEVATNKLLHVPQTDLVRGYIALAFSSMVSALGVWLVLRLSAASEITKTVLRSLVGVVVLFLPAGFWAYMYQRHGWPFGWPYRWAPMELVLALVCAVFYLRGKLHYPAWFGVLLLAAHYTYWFWIPGGSYYACNYAGPMAPLLGFSSALAWALYVSRLSEMDAAHP